jgi:prevent-host-death family protein
MRVNVGRAKTDLAKLLARVEAGEEIEIARDGIPVARLVAIDATVSRGEQFLAARGSLAGRLSIGDNFEFTEAELEQSLDDPA